MNNNNNNDKYIQIYLNTGQEHECAWCCVQVGHMSQLFHILIQ